MPRPSSKSTQPHNNTRPTKRPNRAKPSARRGLLNRLSLLVVLRKMPIERPYAALHQNTTSANDVKAIAYIKRESKRFHKQCTRPSVAETAGKSLYAAR
jgi:hypothetical protein